MNLMFKISEMPEALEEQPDILHLVEVVMILVHLWSNGTIEEFQLRQYLVDVLNNFDVSLEVDEVTEL